MGVQLAIDGAYLGYFPEVSIRCYLGDGRLKALGGIEPGPPVPLRAVTRLGVRPKASALRLIEELQRTIAVSMAAGHQCE